MIVKRHNVVVDGGMMTDINLQVPAYEIPILMSIHGAAQVHDKGPIDGMLFEFESIQSEYDRMIRRYKGNTESENGTNWVDEAYGNPMQGAFGQAIESMLVKEDRLISRSIAADDQEDADELTIDKDSIDRSNIEDLTRLGLFEIIGKLKIAAPATTRKEVLITCINKALMVLDRGEGYPPGISLKDFLETEIKPEFFNQSAINE